MSRRRLSDSDVDALVSGHTPPQRPDLAPIAAFLRELPAQLSESEPIELAAPPRRRTRLLVAIAASAAALLALGGLVAIRSGDGVVRPAVGGPALVTTAGTTTAGTTQPADSSGSTVVAPVTTAMTREPASLPAATPATGEPGSTTPETAASTPAERYVAAVLAWHQCVNANGIEACGPAPDPAAFGLPTTTAAGTTGGPATSVATAPPQQAPGVSPPCSRQDIRPGLEHPDVMTC